MNAARQPPPRGVLSAAFLARFACCVWFLTAARFGVIASCAGQTMSTQTLADPFSHRVPSDEPEVELLRGVEVPKVRPKRTHGVLQGELFLLLRAWAGTRGQVAVEWRFHLGGVAGEETT